MFQYLKNNPSLIAYTIIAIICNVGYLYNGCADVWYWCLWLPLSVGGLIAFVYDYYRS